MSATDRPLTAATRLFTRIVEDPLNAGLALLVATAAALIVANSALSSDYVGLFKTYVAGLSIGHWINDGLMAGFFLLVGLELKREIIDGELSTWSQRILPGIAAAGGIIVPALIFSALNWNDDQAMAGWAIPTATDIAFALGILLLLGSRIPVALKVLLTTIAVLDDLVAIAIIALFYTADLSMAMLGLAGVALVGLLLLNRSGISALWPYLVTGLVLWFFVLQSGVHATLAGVALAVAIPFKSGTRSPLLRLEHAIQPWVAFLILPVFAFANAGVSLAGLTFSSLAGPLTLGIAAGLFLGKQIGILGSVWLAEKTGLAARPEGVSWAQIYGVALLCGIGFTMSLFIGLLAFSTSDTLQDATKIGVLMGSVVSAILGYLVLRWACRKGA